MAGRALGRSRGGRPLLKRRLLLPFALAPGSRSGACSLATQSFPLGHEFLLLPFQSGLLACALSPLLCSLALRRRLLLRLVRDRVRGGLVVLGLSPARIPGDDRRDHQCRRSVSDPALPRLGLQPA